MTGDYKIIELQEENQYLLQLIEVYKDENHELTKQLQHYKELFESHMRIVDLLCEYYDIPQGPGVFNEPEGSPGKEEKV